MPDNTIATSQRWQRLMPLVFVTYSLAYLDRSNYSIGVAGGLKHDLGLGAGSSALLGALFFVGYFIFQIPAAHYAENKSVSRLIFWTVLLWGVLVGLGSGSMALSLVATVTGRWFVARRGLVSGVLTAGGAAGQLIFLPVVAWLATNHGWRTAALLAAAAALAVIPLVLLFLRNHPADMGPPDKRARPGVNITHDAAPSGCGGPLPAARWRTAPESAC